MNKKTILGICLAVTALSVGLGSLSLVTTATPKTVTAVVAAPVVAPATPNNLMIASLKATAWQANCLTYNYAFRFTGVNSSSVSVTAWSKLAGWTIGKTSGEYYDLAALSPAVDGVSSWTSVELYRFSSSILAPANGLGSDYVKTSAVTITPTTTTNSSSVTTTVQNYCLVIPSGTAVPASGGTATATRDVWTSQFPNRDLLASYCAEFMANTGLICAQSGHTASSFYTTWTYLSNLYSSGLSSLAQGYFKSGMAATTDTYVPANAVETTNGNDVSATFRNFAIKRYDYMMSKYASDTTINDFANRSATKAAAVVASTNDSSASYLLGGLAVVSALAATSYFIIRKKKQA